MVKLCHYSRAVRVLIPTSLLITVLLGCQTANDRSVAIWRSEHASPKQRMEAASRLVPIGTRQIEAERILGHPTRSGRFHGPVIYAPGYVGPTNVAYFDQWADFYDLAHGDYVSLTFDVEASRNSWEDRPLLFVTRGNTNDEMTISTDKPK